MARSCTKVDHFEVHKVPLVDSPYGPADGRVFKGRMLVRGAYNPAGFRISYIPVGVKARMEHGGPLVPGPWACAYPLACVLDNAGGTPAEIAREQSEGKVLLCSVGDLLDLDGVLFRVAWATYPTGTKDREHVKLYRARRPLPAKEWRRLRELARFVCSSKGHTMARFSKRFESPEHDAHGRYIGMYEQVRAYCVVCGCEVDVRPYRADGEQVVSGSAVVRTCRKEG